MTGPVSETTARRGPRVWAVAVVLLPVALWMMARDWQKGRLPR